MWVNRGWHPVMIIRRKTLTSKFVFVSMWVNIAVSLLGEMMLKILAFHHSTIVWISCLAFWMAYHETVTYIMCGPAGFCVPRRHLQVFYRQLRSCFDDCTYRNPFHDTDQFLRGILRRPIESFLRLLPVRQPPRRLYLSAADYYASRPRYFHTIQIGLESRSPPHFKTLCGLIFVGDWLEWFYRSRASIDGLENFFTGYVSSLPHCLDIELLQSSFEKFNDVPGFEVVWLPGLIYVSRKICLTNCLKHNDAFRGQGVLEEVELPPS